MWSKVAVLGRKGDSILRVRVGGLLCRYSSQGTAIVLFLMQGLHVTSPTSPSVFDVHGLDW